MGCSLNGTTETDYYTPATSDVYANDRDILHAPAAGFCDTNTYLLILVNSHHDNEHLRNAARKTWTTLSNQNKPKFLANFTIPKFNIVFMFGRHVNRTKNENIVREHILHGDIIQVNFNESYHNLTLKSLAGLKWVNANCPSSLKYVMKTDDDSFVNVAILAQKLQQLKSNRAMIGICLKSKVQRGSASKKWAVSCADFPFKQFPQYLAGHGYVISADLVKELILLSKRQRRIHIEDAYITGILRRVAGNVTLECNKGFSHAYRKSPNTWDFPSKGVTHTVGSAWEMHAIWRYYMIFEPPVTQNERTLSPAPAAPRTTNQLPVYH